MISPEESTHQFSTSTPYPDPSMQKMNSTMLARPDSTVSSDMTMLDHGNSAGYVLYSTVQHGSHRATAYGSPMPFTRTRNQMPSVCYDRHTSEVPPTPPSQVGQYVSTANNHFHPGWYYARDQTRSAVHPVYSFSTAASKMIGSDQAPDSRIRDSYKTDTLTAVSKPTSRYRKNGIGADLMPRGVGRFYQRPPLSTRMLNARMRPSSRQTYSSGSDIRFRSSPPPRPGSEYREATRPKRALDDFFTISELRQVVDPNLRLHGSNEIMEVDEQTDAAVRLSIFGTADSPITPEVSQQARQGIRKLSPNIQGYRKNNQGCYHLRKKRRPSYWDNELKKIRESPAGRGGVNSPVSAQASMSAEFEIASLRNTEMELDEGDLSGEVAKAGNDLESRLSGLADLSTVSIFENSNWKAS